MTRMDDHALELLAQAVVLDLLTEDVADDVIYGREGVGDIAEDDLRAVSKRVHEALGELANRRQTTHVTGTTRYAIQLPNGKLLDSIDEWSSSGYEYEMLPNGEWVYLWDAADQAVKTLESAACAVEYGMGDHFRELAKVVRVRVVTTIDITSTWPEGFIEVLS